ncbi:MAG: PocR ligand-binding domain-containing protein [Syntrophomonadaceae bacterium]
MKNEDKTKEQLIKELSELQQKNAELESLIKTLNQSSVTPANNLFTTELNENFILLDDEHRTVNKSPKHDLSKLIDMPLLQQILDSFYVATKLPYAILDKDNNIFCARGWQDICTKFHLICPQTKSRCVQSNRYLFAPFQDEGYIGHKCLNGLMDYAAPIIIEGQYLAAITTGQFLHEPPDEEFFRKQAQQNGFDEKAYLEALRRIPIISEELARSTMRYYAKIGHLASSMVEERLRRIEETEDKFLKALHCIPDPVTITTFDTGHYVYVNDAWVETTGYEKNEAIGRSSTNELGVYVDFEERNLMLKEIRAKGYVRNLETPFRMKSGEIKKFLSSFEMMVIDNEPHLLGVHKDITERTHMEKTLKDSEEKFSKAFHTTPDSVAISTIREGRFIEANDSFFNWTGYERHEVLGHTAMELGLWVDPTERASIIKGLTEKGSVRNLEVRFRNKSGDIRTCLCSAELINIGSEPNFLSLVKDITKEKKMESEIAHFDRLNLIGEIAASIGHEIRNPMTAVRGFLQMLNRKECYKEDWMFFNLMIEELDRANHIISEFLGMAKDKRVELQHQYLDEVVKSLYPMIQADANYNEMDIHLDLSNPPMSLIDAKEIRQLIMNMARNGLEAMSPGGILTIGTTCEENEIILFIKDQGHGLDPQVIDKLGTPFFSTKDNGTGLGLAICYSIAARHKARINCETGPYGTTFKVYFPVTTEQTQLIQGCIPNFM